MRATATEIVRRLQAAGHAAFWVGGCVRDRLLGKEPQDFDIATSARPEQIEALFTKTIPVGRQFGVVVVIEGGHPFQVATFRAEAEYSDGRRPDKVTFCDARADASRRDFTVNGLFFDPVKGEPHDWVNGRADLEKKILRTIGEPHERFGEDHLRLLRAVRFAAQLGFDLEPGTLAALQSLAARITSVSAERIRDELLKLFQPPHAARGLDLLRESGLLPHVLPELAPTIGCAQSPEFHPEGDVFTHIRLLLANLPPDAHPSLPWTALLHDIAKPATAVRQPDGRITFYGHEKIGAEMAEALLTRLRFPRKQTEEIAFVVLHHMQFKDAPQMRKATLRRLLLRETFPLELAQHRLDCLASHGLLDIHDFLRREAVDLANQPQLAPPLVTGADLLGLGLKPGPALGELLHEIRDKQLAEELATRDAALAWAKEKAGI